MSKIKLAVIKFATYGSFILALPFIAASSVSSQNAPGTTQGVVPVVNYEKEISGTVRPYNANEVLVALTQSTAPIGGASPIANVPIFDQAVVRNPLNLELFDQNAPADGNVINVVLNGQIVSSNLILTSTTQTVTPD